MQSRDLCRALGKISALAAAIGELSLHTHSDTIEPALAELVTATRDIYERVIDANVTDGAFGRTVVEDHEDGEARRLAAPCQS
jgi:hypothetical protein